MITIIGYDGSPLSPDATAAIAAADVVVGGRRHLAATTPPADAEIIVMGPVASAVAAISAAHASRRNVVVLASGDPGFFGITRRLRDAGLAFTVLPAVSAVATAFARLALPWDEAVVVSAHGRPIGPALNALRRFGRGPTPIAVLTDGSISPADVVTALGPECPDFTVLERLGEDDERITLVSDTAPGALSRTAALSKEWRQPNLLVAGGSGSLDDPPWRSGVSLGQAGWALPDEDFSHRDGMLTKRDVRAAVLARLAPAVGQVIWDVGAGSGSVAVECSRLGAAVIAIEQDPEQLEHIAANVLDHQAPVQVVHGKAPDALRDLPHPDAVFIGGGGPEVVRAVAAVRPDRVVVALVTLERVAPTVQALEGYELETVLLQVQHLVPLGDGHRLAPANPVFLVSGVRP